MQKADSRIKDIEQGHNTRYFVFLMLAFVAGGKLENTSRSMVRHGTVRPRSWLFSGIKFIVHNTLLVVKFLTAERVLPLLQRLVQQVKGYYTVRIKIRMPKSAAEHHASSGKK